MIPQPIDYGRWPYWLTDPERNDTYASSREELGGLVVSRSRETSRRRASQSTAPIYEQHLV